MKTLWKYLTLLILSISADTLYAETISGASKIILSQTPEEAFHLAVKKKDFRLLTIPFCGGITPGFNFRAYKEKKLEENNLSLSCFSLLGNEEMKALSRLESWVEKYNKLMFNQLNNHE